MKKPLLYLTLILLVAGCKSDKQNIANQISPLFPAPKTIAFDTGEGYTINPITGDSIQPLVNWFGDTLITGKPIPVKGKVISLDSFPKPKVVPVGNPDVLPAYDNSLKIPDHVMVIPVNIDTLPFFEPTLSTDSIVLTNSTNDTIPTGVPISVKGKTVSCIYPRPVEALPPRFKEGAVKTMRYLDMGQGLNTRFITCMLEDKQGNLWFGTNVLGVSKYDGENLYHYTVDEGFPDTYVSTIMEDRQGNLWFGTMNSGVCKYDGENFTYFTEEEGLSRNDVKSILEDKQGNLWIGTVGGGVCKYNGENFIHITLKEGLSCRHVFSMLEDKKGNLWFGTGTCGVTKYDGKNFTHIKKRNGLIGNGNISSILEDKYGNIWFATDSGVSKYDGKSFTNYTEKEGLSGNSVKSILEDRNGNIWFAIIGGGVNKFGGKKFYHYGEKEGLSGDYITCMEEDDTGNLWFGTRNGGVTKYDPGKFTRYMKNEGLPDNPVISIREDNNENIWFGTQGGGLSKYNGKNFTHYGIKEGLQSNTIRAIQKDKKGNLWLGTGGQGGISTFEGKNFVHFTTDQGLSYGSVTDILEDKNGNLWFGIIGWNEVVKYDGDSFTFFYENTEKELVFNSNVWEIYEDRNENIWFGSVAGGVSKYDGTSLTFISEKEGLSHNKVIAIQEDKSGNLWFATNGGGLNKFDGKSITHYTEKEGLAHNLVVSLLLDNDGNIWAATKKGLSCLQINDHRHEVGHPSNFRIYNFTIEDGLIGSNFYNPNSAFLDSKNRAWWGSGKGLSMLDLNTFSFPDQPPNVQLNYVEINEQFIDYRNLPDSFKLKPAFNGVARFCNYPLKLQLPFDNNHLTFYFSAIDWYAPHKIKYSYKMESLNDNWSIPKNNTKADYRNLPYGTHTFKVRAIGASMEWSDAFEYTFTILPPWWHTWWARSLYAFLGISIIFGYVQWRTQNLKKQKKVLEQTVKERTVELKEQKERAERSERYKEQFLANMSHEIRTPMHAISGMTNILARNEHPEHQDKFLKAIQENTGNLLVILNDILDLSKIEAGKIEIEHIPMNPSQVVGNVAEVLRLKAEEKKLILLTPIAEGIPEKVMGDPTRLAQILLNLIGNAIKFTEKGKIELSVTEVDSKLRFSVQDTGIGIPKEKLENIFGSFEQADVSTTREYGGTGLGLSISKQLVELQNGTIWVESQIGIGSTFIFELPFELVEADEKMEGQVSEEQLMAMAASLSGIKILLAEDNAFNIMVARDDLEFYIPEVKIGVAENGKEAIHEFENGNFDLILMDMHMPEMNGYDATKAIRELEASRENKKPIPIIAMTASLLKSELDQCFEAGMNNYIPKPYKYEELIGRIYEEINKAHSPT